ncbi:Choline-sulfatase [Sporotomaculum syntrophicum]|uniref:Choline-sulfatase n=1 Tax=Sporotomaculum syntrophicum TaxID=182264 RepID=A0A9D2WR84_9FIRM|nr:sulfatase-like hydrolase/transferase [Sporotomaculum syntrophicum]KAF1085132.1 Choline-sulfatase [Sporotomaculum syntrophicum]
MSNKTENTKIPENDIQQKCSCMSHFPQRPNFLFLMVDEERFPPAYESSELKEWRKRNLVTQELLRRNGVEFMRHYTGSTACSPSRATLFTGHYPSLHGVTQTDGVAKGAFDQDVFWLDFNTVPTMGDYFRTAGYRTFYKGKWHISQEDILIPGTKNSFPSYNPVTGVPDPEGEEIYRQANRMNRFGFNGWIGPEPHGINPRNSASSAAHGLSGRDVVFSHEAVKLIKNLENEKQANPDHKMPPWLIVCSLVNPHDITLFGALTRLNPQFNFTVDPTVPNVPPAPTANENLNTKPRAQRSYRITYPEAFQPLADTNLYRRLYYQLQKNADQEMLRVFEALKKSPFYEDTLVIFVSDHGELLGAHGLFQKWYCAYEEAIHVPFIIHNPRLFTGRKSIDMLTSHVDILPTMLGLAGINAGEVRDILRRTHNEVHPLVGRDLSPLVLDEGEPERAGEPLFFMSDDDVTRGLNQVSALGQPYNSVLQPNHIQTVIANIRIGEGEQTWKYSCYYDNPQFWSNPGVNDEVTRQLDGSENVLDEIKASVCKTTIKTRPVPEQIEMYNLSEDPLEQTNLAHPRFSTPETRVIQQTLARILEEQCRQKRLEPASGTVPGMPSCSICGPSNPHVPGF